MGEKMNGARLFARMLKAYGVTHVFFMDAILRRALAEMEDVGIKRILGHSEKAVAYMADGYARASGRPGVCMAQSVGAANLASGMQDPYLGHSPVIAISGRHAALYQYRNAYQEVPHEPLYQSVTKWQGRIDVLEQERWSSPPASEIGHIRPFPPPSTSAAINATYFTRHRASAPPTRTAAKDPGPEWRLAQA